MSITYFTRTTLLPSCIALLVSVLTAAAPAGAQRIGDSCFGDRMCVFSGFVNVALGEATLAISPSGYPEYPRELGVTNHGSGFAGVRQYVDSFDMETRLAVPNFTLSEAGAQLVGLQRGIVDGDQDVVFSSMTITNNGNGLTVEGDWSAINPTSYRIDIFLGDELIGFEDNLPTGIFDEDTLPGPKLADCNHNRIPDYGEIAAGITPDANGDGRPDDCQPPV